MNVTTSFRYLKAEATKTKIWRPRAGIATGQKEPGRRNSGGAGNGAYSLNQA